MIAAASIARLRALAELGLTMAAAARATGLSVGVVRDRAQRFDLPFRRRAPPRVPVAAATAEAAVAGLRAMMGRLVEARIAAPDSPGRRRRSAWIDR
jgi:hypothetical protein